jgi:integrase
VLYYKDKNKKNKTKWIPTGYEIKGNKRNAETMLPEFMEKYKNLEYKEPDNSKILFTDAITQWLASKKNKIELSTYEGYKSYIDCHIIPYFELLGLTIDEIKPKHIKDYYEDRFKRGKYGRDDKGGLSVRSIRKHGVVFKQVFADAFVNEPDKKNPAIGVKYPTNEKPEFKGKFLTGEEANKMLQAFTGHELQAIVYVTLYYGLRRSEALGLRWSAVDFEENTIKIEHRVVRVLSLEYKDGTKNKKTMRTFPLLADVRALLLNLKKRQSENQRIFGNTYIESDYIFKWQDGRLYKPDYVTRSFKRVLKRHGLKVIRFHDLRHSTASILYDKGWELKDIQDWLSHADIQTTGNIYTHITNSRKQATAKSLERTFVI